MKFKLGKKSQPLLSELMAERGWQRTKRNDWQFFWGRSLPDESGAHDGPRACNHLPGFSTIAQKGSMARLLGHAQARATRAGDDRRWRFFPRTFEMPRQLAEFRAAAAADPAAAWIAKPASNTHGGEGQFLLMHPGEAPTQPGWLVQQYLGRMHLLDRRKYSIRVYTLTTSLDPFVAYIYTDGLVKRMTLPYSDAPEDRSNRLLHLSNSGVQKRAPGGLLPRLRFAEYRAWLEREGADFDALWRKIRRICALVLLAGREEMIRARPPEMSHPSRNFNLWGPDILVDEQFDPWMVECNGNPGMAITSPPELAGYAEERIQKKNIIEETLRMTGVFQPGPDGEWPPRRFGGWELLFPDAEALEWTADWLPRRRDRTLFVQLGLPEPVSPRVPLPPGALLVEDGVIAYVPACNRLVALNAAATSLLFFNQEGRSSAEIAALLGPHEGTPPEELIDRVDQTLADAWQLDTPDRWHEPEPAPEVRPLADESVAVVRTYAIGPAMFRVRFAREGYAAAVEPTLAHLRVADDLPTMETIDVMPGKKGVRVRSAAETIAFARPDRLASALHSAMLHRACAAPAVVAALHAGAVVRGGRSLILAGESGAGKTTLTAALCGAGYAYLSDEAAILDERFDVRPAPMALGLTPEVLPLLRPWFPAANLLPACFRRDGTPVHFLPPPVVSAEATPVTALIFPQVAAGAPAQLRSLGPAEALTRLSRTGLELPRTLGAEPAARLLDWLRRTPRFELRYHALDDAVRLIGEQIYHGVGGG